MAVNVSNEPQSVSFQMGNQASATAMDVVDVSSADYVLNRPCRAIFVGGAGDLYVGMVDQPDRSQLISTVPAGAWLPISVIKIYKTTTTATLIRVFY